jgi:hypothetical protein
MEEENHGQFKTEMAKQNLANTFPVVFAHIDLVLWKIRLIVRN